MSNQCCLLPFSSARDADFVLITALLVQDVTHLHKILMMKAMGAVDVVSTSGDKAARLYVHINRNMNTSTQSRPLINNTSENY